MNCMPQTLGTRLLWIRTHDTHGIAVENARARSDSASAPSTPPAAVLQADRMTQSASSLRVEISDAER
jgi:hypothetical protein